MAAFISCDRLRTNGQAVHSVNWAGRHSGEQGCQLTAGKYIYIYIINFQYLYIYSHLLSKLRLPPQQGEVPSPNGTV